MLLWFVLSVASPMPCEAPLVKLWANGQIMCADVSDTSVPTAEAAVQDFCEQHPAITGVTVFSEHEGNGGADARCEDGEIDWLIWFSGM